MTSQEDIGQTAPSTAYLQEALAACRLITRSLGIERQFKEALDAGRVPLAIAEPLPSYTHSDPRAGVPQLMAQLHLHLSVIDGLLGVIESEKPKEAHVPLGPIAPFMGWFSDRAQALGDIAKTYALPPGVEALLREKAKVLAEMSQAINFCLYSTEEKLVDEAAQYAIERNVGAILFLALFPNIPFIVPTLEVRLLITKPLLIFAEAGHKTLGKVPLFGLIFLLVRNFARLLDGIPRLQVRIVQRWVMRRWTRNSGKRAQVVQRYLKAIERRSAKPRIDAIQRALISLVS